jgi:hypothetical protein
VIFSELQRGARFRCRLPESRAPVDCVKLSPSRFRRLDTGKYIKATSTAFPVVLITTTPSNGATNNNEHFPRG